MRLFALAIAAATAFALSAPASATEVVSTDISAQSIRLDPGGVRVGVGHERWESRRRDRRVHDRWESRGRDRVIVRERGPSCRTVTVRERIPGGGVRVIKRREC